MLVLLAFPNSLAHSGESAPRPPDSPSRRSLPASLSTSHPRNLVGLPPYLSPTLSETAEVWANTRGGEQRGFVYTGVLAFGGEIALEGDDAGTETSLGVEGLWLQGENPSPKAIGDIGIASNTAGVSTVRLFKMWAEQLLSAGRVKVKVGVIALDDDFMVLESAQLFVNSGFGTLQTEALNIKAPIYPLGALGVRTLIQPLGHWEVQFGAYDGDAGVEQDNRYISDLELDADEGATLLAEASFRTKRTHLGWGTFYHVGDVQDYARTDRARGLVGPYAMAERELGRIGRGALTGFFHASLAAPYSRAVAARYADAGLVWQGSAWGRPGDRLGVGVAVTDFGKAYLAASRRQGATLTSTEWVLESTYRAHIFPWVLLQPTVQWIIDPHYSQNDSLAIATRVRAEL